MTRRFPTGPAALAGLSLLLAGCESSGRFGGYPAGPSRAVLPPVGAAPTARVEASPLPPPVRGEPLAPPPRSGGMDLSGLPDAGSSVRIDPPPAAGRELDLGQPSPQPVFPQPPIEPGNPPAERQAALPRPAPTAPPAASGPPSRTAVIGNWTAREASGGSCRVTLSSSPSLDLYKASSSGCQSRDLQRVTAWELRGDEVYLYESGGGVAARLKQGGGGFQGASAKSGAPITLTK